MKRGDFTDRDIHLALDGELAAEDREDFLAWLSAHPEKKARHDRFAEDRERLQGALAGVLEEPVPPRLTAAVLEGRSGPRRAAPWWRAAAAVALLLAGGAGGFVLGAYLERREPGPERLVAERAIEAHVLYAAEQRHVVEVGADEKDHLVGWLSKRVGTTLIAPDFSNAGYRLVGGRLLPADTKAAAMFIYEDAAGERISLYVVRDAGAPDAGFKLRERLGACSLYWLDGGYGYALTGSDMADETLEALAGSAYRQLLDAQRS